MLEKLPPCLHLQRKPWMVQSAMKNTYPAVVSRKSPEGAYLGLSQVMGVPRNEWLILENPIKTDDKNGVPRKPLSGLIKK